MSYYSRQTKEVRTLKGVDGIRGFEREIKYAVAGGHVTGRGWPLTNCVVEVAEDDRDGRCPMLLLRFYHRLTYSDQVAQECA